MATQDQLDNLEKARAAKAAKKAESKFTQEQVQQMIDVAVAAAIAATKAPTAEVRAPAKGEEAVGTIPVADRKANSDAIQSLPAEVPGNGQMPPGTRVVVGRDRYGQDVYGRIEWRREDIEGNYPWSYPKVTFIPAESVVVSPHGIKYQLSADQEITVPSIVRDIYNEWRRNRREAGNAHPPLSPDEDYRVSRAAVDSGLGISRVFRIGYGPLGPDTNEAA